jgi:hypothetical protein
MQVAIVAVAALAIVVSAQGESGDQRRVTVYVSNGVAVPFSIKGQAEGLASEMFARVGVTVEWRLMTPAVSKTDAIVIEFVTETPKELLPGAWAYALPFEGVHIRIFWDRMKLESSPRELLAHVMVHEITHILQGTDSHSSAGIMHARWTAHERFSMERRPLSFTSQDVYLIYRGLDHRGSRAPNPPQSMATLP